MSEAQLLADESLFHVRLQPMVEGSVWTSERGGGDAPPAAGDILAAAGSDAGAPAGAGGSVGGTTHDATEL